MGIADTHMNTMHFALDGLARRGEVRANNVANAETPGFLASGVNFESALADALQRHDIEGVRDPGAYLRDTLPDIHGNTVDLETETVEMLEDGIMTEAMSASYTAKVTRWRTAMSR
jgi:flagellar basal-body rod protein FlgB